MFFEQIAEVFRTQKYMEWLLQGLEQTLIISLGAAVLGLILGTIVAAVKIASKRSIKMKPFEVVCDLYVGVIRGTPVALQLFIMAFAVFAIRGFPLVITAVLTFGINSGAYVAESLRAGIQSVDIGQMEAGRTLGMSYSYTMGRVVVPQAIKNVIPAIGNELIALIKETSIVSMIGMVDLTMAAKLVGAGNEMATYLAPMVVAAMFYLLIVYAIIIAIKLIERRLKKSDRSR